MQRITEYVFHFDSSVYDPADYLTWPQEQRTQPIAQRPVHYVAATVWVSSAALSAAELLDTGIALQFMKDTKEMLPLLCIGATGRAGESNTFGGWVDRGPAYRDSLSINVQVWYVRIDRRYSFNIDGIDLPDGSKLRGWSTAVLDHRVDVRLYGDQC